MTPSRFLSRLLIGAVLSVSAVLLGCGGGGSGSSGAGNGTLTVAMSDGAGTGITAVNVTINRVEANVNGAWVPIATTPRTFDLLSLVKDDTILGSATLPAGHYTQIRLFPSAATVTDASGMHPVTIPSGVQSGVKLNVDYTIGPNQVTTVLLDFSVQRSLVRQGNGTYLLQPVIPAVVQVLSGTVTGTVAAIGGKPAAGATVTAVYELGPGYQTGAIANMTTAGVDGTFKLWALLPGTYMINIGYTDPVSGTTASASDSGVVVTANENTDIGTIIVH